MEKQINTDELTLIQKIALEGEVAKAMFNAPTIEAKKYVAFFILAASEEKYTTVYKDVLSTYMDVELLEDFIAYKKAKIIPTYIISDFFCLELSLMLEGKSVGNLLVNKQPMEVIRSKFVNLMSVLIPYIPNTMTAILDNIVNELGDKISFLYPAIMVLKSQADTSIDESKFDYTEKLKALSYQLLDTPCMEFKDTLNSEENTTKEEEYIVKKIDKISNKEVGPLPKSFKSIGEANNYIDKLLKDYPQLTDRFDFIVERH